MVVSLGLGHCQGLLCIRGIKRVSFLVLAGHGWVLPGLPDCCRVDCAGMEGCSPFEPAVAWPLWLVPLTLILGLLTTWVTSPEGRLGFPPQKCCAA